MKKVDYNDFAKTFAKSRKNMKWEEIYYFFNKIWKFEWLNILDIWCWSWRLVSHIKDYFDGNFSYTWIDSSQEMINEAKKEFMDYDFFVQNMKEISLEKKYDLVFFIASFHHLKTIEERIEVLKNLKNYLKKDSIIFMTNWSLDSELNSWKYFSSKIPNSQNEFWWIDYNIKIWDFYRYYHSFSIKELDYIFKESWFEILENRSFETQKNFISIIKKIWD